MAACWAESYDSVGSLEAFPPDGDAHVDEGEGVASFPPHLDTCPLHAFPLEPVVVVVAGAVEPAVPV